MNFTLLALILLWAYLLSLLLRGGRTPPLEGRLVADVGSSGGTEEWMGVYLKDKKVGWVVIVTDELEDGYHIVERSNLILTVMGTKQRVRSLIECHADTSYALRRLSFQFGSGEYQLRLKGEIEGRSLRYELVSGGQTTHSEIPLPEEVYIPVSIEAVASKMGLVEGKVDSFDIFEPTTRSLTKVRVMVEGREEIVLGGLPRKATKLVASFLGTTSTIWLAEDGSVLKEESPLGLTMLRETREEAIGGELPSEGVDILTLYAVPSNQEIPNPRRVTRLRLRLTEAQLERLEIEDERQKLLEDTLLVSASSPSLRREPAIDPERFQEDLRPTPLIQCEDDKIRALVDSIVNTQDSPWLRARELVAWVHENIEKRPTMSIPSAVEVLEHREGDCNEHAILFAALARASGVPARICGGLVYLEGGFYYHAWSKVWVGEWVSVDPTFGQSVADATHIKLVEGGLEDLLDLVGVIGKLKIEVLEYR